MDFKIVRERIGDIEGFIQINAELFNQYTLQIFEYYSIHDGVIKYRYHVMDTKKEFVIRWDNAPHHSEIPSFPHHFHVKNEIHETKQYSLQKILSLIPNYLKLENNMNS